MTLCSPDLPNQVVEAAFVFLHPSMGVLGFRQISWSAHPRRSPAPEKTASIPVENSTEKPCGEVSLV